MICWPFLFTSLRGHTINLKETLQTGLFLLIIYFRVLITHLTNNNTIPHPNLKSRLKDLVTNSFRAKSGKRRYSYIVIHGLKAYFVKDHTNSKTKYTEHDIVNMINFLINNIFIEFGGRIFQQTVGIPMGTNYAPLLVDFFLHSYEVCPRTSS